MPPVLSLKTALTEAQESDLSYLGPLRPLIIGPKAKLTRYVAPSEKADGLIGNYDSDDNVTFDIPNFDAGNVFDSEYAKLAVTMDNAHFLYASKVVGDANGTIVPDADYGNRIVADDLNFKVGIGIHLLSKLQLLWASEW